MSHALGFACAAAATALAIATAVVAQPQGGEGGVPDRSAPSERRGPPGGDFGGERRIPREGGGLGGEPAGPPSAERMIDHAMRFDADGDGKLDRTELTKMFEQMQAMRTRGGPGGPGGGPRQSGPREGFGGPDGFRGRPDGGGPPRGEGRSPGAPGGPGFGPGGQGRGPTDGPQRDRNEL